MKPIINEIRDMGINFDVLEEIWVIDGILINECPLRIGRPEEELGVAVDLPIEKLPDGRVYIPGSSIKGVLRSLVERILRTQGRYVCNTFLSINKCKVAIQLAKRLYEVEMGWKKIDISGILRIIKEGIGSSPPPEVETLLKNLEDMITKINKEEDRKRGILIFLKKEGLPCDVCKLFGNTELSSHIVVENAYPIHEVGVGYRTRVAIDRFRRASRSRALFTYEYVLPEQEWKFRLKVYNPTSLKHVLKLMIDYIKDVGLEEEV